MLTEKENYMMMLKGEVPEWVPRYTYGPMPGMSFPPANAMVEPFVLSPHRANYGQPGTDIWGVDYIPVTEAEGGLIPKTWDFIMDDITKWRDIIKAPSLEGVDWEQQANLLLNVFHIDRSQTAVTLNLHMGYFQQLMSFMGFTDGLIALLEEPEEVKALNEYMCNFYCEATEKIIDVLKPDVLELMDDTASIAAPFMSLDMFRDLYLPFYKRQISYGVERGLPVQLHNCGKCGVFMDDFVNIGVTAWDPAEPSNDLLGFKEKYGNKLCIFGGWKQDGKYARPDFSDEELIETVKVAIDNYAPGGGFACVCGVMGAKPGDPLIIHKNEVLSKFVIEYGKDFYKTH